MNALTVNATVNSGESLFSAWQACKRLSKATGSDVSVEFNGIRLICHGQSYADFESNYRQNLCALREKGPEALATEAALDSMAKEFWSAVCEVIADIKRKQGLRFRAEGK